MTKQKITVASYMGHYAVTTHVHRLSDQQSIMPNRNYYT